MTVSLTMTYDGNGPQPWQTLWSGETTGNVNFYCLSVARLSCCPRPLEVRVSGLVGAFAGEDPPTVVYTAPVYTILGSVLHYEVTSLVCSSTQGRRWANTQNGPRRITKVEVRPANDTGNPAPDDAWCSAAGVTYEIKAAMRAGFENPGTTCGDLTFVF